MQIPKDGTQSETHTLTLIQTYKIIKHICSSLCLHHSHHVHILFVNYNVGSFFKLSCSPSFLYSNQEMGKPFEQAVTI